MAVIRDTHDNRWRNIRGCAICVLLFHSLPLSLNEEIMCVQNGSLTFIILYFRSNDPLLDISDQRAAAPREGAEDGIVGGGGCVGAI